MQIISNKKLVLLLAAASLGGCTTVVQFEGKSGLEIAGRPPPVIHHVAPVNTRVKVTDKAIEINEKVQFEVNKATILPESFGLLDEVAGAIKQHPEIKHVEIQGHASSEGDHTTNLTLSDSRAKSVMTYLTTKGGVEVGRLTAIGYGDKVPLADNNTEEGRVKNRRVEFHITEKK
jgi:OOP family OmpA-OmpF porin